MYWTDNLKIQKSDLDGSNITELPVAAIDPIGIALDLVHGKVYWVEQYLLTAQIRRSDLDGSNEETVLSGSCGPDSTPCRR